MFQVLAPVTIHLTTEARKALGDQLRPAGKAAWREIARRSQGLEFANLQFSFVGVTLALCSRLRADGVIVIEIGLDDARQESRVVTAAQFRRAEAQAARRRTGGGGNADVDAAPWMGLPARPLDEPGCPIHSAKTTVLACLWLRDAWCWLFDASASVRGALT